MRTETINNRKEKGNTNKFIFISFIIIFIVQSVILININMNKRIKNQTLSDNILSESLSSNPEEEKISNKKKKELKGYTINNECRIKKKNRKINSLEVLSKKFIKYAIESNSRIINLQSMAKAIKVKKRRIYDITNVLEGNY